MTSPEIDQAASLYAQGSFAEAAKLLESSPSCERSAAICINLCRLYFLLLEPEKAKQWGQRALALDSNPEPGLLVNLANAYSALTDFDAAEGLINEGLRAHPHSVELLVAKGLLLQQRGLVTQALKSHRLALQIEPNNREALLNSAACLGASMQIEKAITLLAHAVALNPQDPTAVSNQAMYAQYRHRLGRRDLESLNASVQRCFPAIDSPSDTGSAVVSANHGQRPRLGLLSADLYRHPVGYFLLGLAEQMQLGTIELIIFDNGSRRDDFNTRFRTAADVWIDVTSMDDKTLAKKIESASLSLLIDLAGHTNGNRLAALALTPTTRRACWLGWFATTGSSFVDGYLMGASLYSPGMQNSFTEKIVVLDAPQFNYTPPYELPSRQSLPSDENGFITFACFNNIAKLNEAVFSCWAGILRNLPNSKLLLKNKYFVDENIRQSVWTRFGILGVEPARVELRAASDHKQMLREYDEVDIALDPFPFNGALTSCEALWMGVPVVSLAQSRLVSRQGLAILSTVGLGELVAKSAGQYRVIALELAENKLKRSLLRKELRGRVIREAAEGNRRLEAALRGLLAQWPC